MHFIQAYGIKRMEKLEEIYKDIAIKLCESQNIQPHFKTVGLGHTMPKGEEYELWQVWAKQVKFVVDEYIKITQGEK